MRLLLFALTQATGGVPVENKIELPVSQQCKAQDPAKEEIVVCGRRNDGQSPYRIKQPPAQAPRSALPKAEIQIGEGVSASAEAEQQDVGGFPSNRAMVRLKIKF